MFKKIVFMLICFVVLLSMSLVQTKAEGGIKPTGHSDILELDFKEPNRGYLLLNQMKSSMIDAHYRKVSKRAFGWSVDVINNEVPIWYISEVVLSKSNNTTNPLVYEYSLRTQVTEEVSMSVSGSIAGKFSGKIKGVTGSLESTIKGEISKKVVNFYEEKTTFDVIVNPGKKVSLLVRGDGEISTGVGKRYFLGIVTKKGTWEYITKLTEYYELYEENI